MKDAESELYPTRQKVIEMYRLNEAEQVHLADELLKVEKAVYYYLKGLV